MGSPRASERRAGVKRPGPTERAALEEAVITKRRRETDRRRASRAIQKELEVESVQFEDPGAFDVLSDRDQRRIGLSIPASISKALVVCPGPQSRKLCLQYALSHHSIRRNLPNYILPFKEAIAQQEIVAGVTKAIEENKTSHSAITLATKHVLLTAAVSAHNQCSMRGVAKILDVHPRNVILAIARRRVIEDHCFHWAFTVRRKRSDGISELVKALVITWWAENTRVSPNRKDVARKRIGPGEYDEKATHYLTESQVTSSFKPAESLSNFHCS